MSADDMRWHGSLVTALIALLVLSGATAADQARVRKAAPLEEFGGLEDLPLLQEADVTGGNYLGGFRMPTATSGGNDWDYAQRGGMSFDAATGHLYVSDGSVCTINIPALVNNADPLFLNLATWQQACIDPGEGNIQADIGNPGNGYQIGGLLRYGSFLYLSAYWFYDANAEATKSHFRRVPTLSTSSYAGLDTVWSGANAPGWTAVYMGRVPNEDHGGTSWQTALGGPAVTGGCCIPIVTRTSNGPALFSFDPDDIYVESEPITATPLIGYPDAHQTLGPWAAQSDLYNGATQVRSVVLINNTRTLLFIGWQGTGPWCYGEGGPGPPTTDCEDPQDATQGTHTWPYRYQMWAYDLLDLAAVKAGTKSMWEPEPYAYWEFTLPTQLANRINIFGADYDKDTKRLYVMQARCHGFDNAYPCVHAFSVDDTP